MINIETPYGSNIQETNRVARYIESQLKIDNQVKYDTTNVGKVSPQIYYNIIPRNEAANFSQFFV